MILISTSSIISIREYSETMQDIVTEDATTIKRVTK